MEGRWVETWSISRRPLFFRRRERKCCSTHSRDNRWEKGVWKERIFRRGTTGTSTTNFGSPQGELWFATFIITGGGPLRRSYRVSGERPSKGGKKNRILLKNHYWGRVLCTGDEVNR